MKPPLIRLAFAGALALAAIGSAHLAAAGPSYSALRPTVTYSAPAASRPAYTAPSAPRAAYSAPSTIRTGGATPPAATATAKPILPGWGVKAPPGYTIRSATVISSVQTRPGAAPTVMRSTLPVAAPATNYRTSTFAGRPVTYSAYSQVPTYASLVHYQGAYFNPGNTYIYHDSSFPYLQFWMWNSYMNQPYGQQYPVGYGPPMGANGQWSASGPAVYDWRRDPCSPRRFFLVRWLFCHRR